MQPDSNFSYPQDGGQTGQAAQFAGGNMMQNTNSGTAENGGSSGASATTNVSGSVRTLSPPTVAVPPINWQNLGWNAMAVLLVIVVTLFTFWGIAFGDVTDNEANFLARIADYKLTVPGLSLLPDFLSREPLFWRCLSALVLVASASMISVWLRINGLRGAAPFGFFAVLCNLPAFVVASSASLDAVVLFLGMMIFVGISILAAPNLADRWINGACKLGGWLLFGGGICGTAALLSRVPPPLWATLPEEQLLTVVDALLFSLPWSVGIGFILVPSLWEALEGHAAAMLAAASVLIPTGIIVSLQAPTLWMSGSLLFIAGGGIAFGIAWQCQLAGELSPLASRLVSIQKQVISIGIPTLAVVIGIYRIGIDYHYMERVQAIVFVSVIVLALVPVIKSLQRKEHWQTSLLGLLALFVVSKIVYVNAYLPERDQWHSPRPYANAIRSLLPPDATLATDLPLSPAYLYYLKARTLPLNGLDLDAAYRNGVYLLAHVDQKQIEANALPEGWVPVRVMEGPGGSNWALFEPQSEKTAFQRRSSTGSSR